MSVYVGIDVHRKRSQVAVVDRAGQVLANRNVPNGVETVLGVIGDLPSGTSNRRPNHYEWLRITLLTCLLVVDLRKRLSAVRVISRGLETSCGLLADRLLSRSLGVIGASQLPSPRSRAPPIHPSSQSVGGTRPALEAPNGPLDPNPATTERTR